MFDAFVTRHRADLGARVCVENNEAMTESYLMIDPHGRFFQNHENSQSDGYAYSRPILDHGVAVAFADTCFRPDRYRSRYQQPLAVETVR